CPAVVRPAAQPTLAAGLAQADVHVVGVAVGPDGGPALGTNAADLARREGDLGPAALASGQGRAGPRAPAQLTAAARLHFQVVDRHAQRDATQRQAIADARLGIFAAHNLVARLEPLRGQDVGLEAVIVLDQGNAGGPVGIVFNGNHGGQNVVFAAP